MTQICQNIWRDKSRLSGGKIIGGLFFQRFWINFEICVERSIFVRRELYFFLPLFSACVCGIVCHRNETITGSMYPKFCTALLGYPTFNSATEGHHLHWRQPGVPLGSAIGICRVWKVLLWSHHYFFLDFFHSFFFARSWVQCLILSVHSSKLSLNSEKYKSSSKPKPYNNENWNAAWENIFHPKELYRSLINSFVFEFPLNYEALSSH